MKLKYLELLESEHSLKIKRIINALIDRWGPTVLVDNIIKEAKKSKMKKKDVFFVLKQFKKKHLIHELGKGSLRVL